MVNCLAKQLKGGVSVDNLPYFEGIRIYSQNDSTPDANNACIIRGLEKPTVETINGTFNVATRTAYEIGILPQTAGAKAVVRNKYGFTFIRNVSQSKMFFDFDDFMHCQELETIKFEDSLITHCGDISDIASMSKLKEFTVQNIGNIVGNIKKLPDTIVKFFARSGDSHNALKANIEDFGNCINIEELSIVGFYDIEGRADKLFESLLTNGKAATEHTNFYVSANATKVTFLGSIIGINTKYAVFSSGRVDVYSDSQHTTRVAYYDGSWHQD